MQSEYFEIKPNDTRMPVDLQRKRTGKKGNVRRRRTVSEWCSSYSRQLYSNPLTSTVATLPSFRERSNSVVC